MSADIPHSTPLRDRTILLTRSAADNEELSALLAGLGAETMFFPMIDVAEPESWDACDDAIARLHTFDAIVFTSRHAVDALIGRIRRLDDQLLPVVQQCTLYAVGEKTGYRLNAHGLNAAHTEKAGTAEDLANSIARNPLTGKRFLFPRGDLARDTLPSILRSHGAVVDDALVYRTVPVRPENLEHVRQRLFAGAIDAALFFSPSAFTQFVNLLGSDAPRQTALAAIGRVTARTITDAGFTPAFTAAVPSSGQLISELRTFFAAGAGRR